MLLQSGFCIIWIMNMLMYRHPYNPFNKDKESRTLTCHCQTLMICLKRIPGSKSIYACWCLR